MNHFRKFSLVAAGAVALSSTAAYADAITLDAGDVGTTFNLTYNGMADGQTITGLTGATSLTLNSITGSNYNFTYTVANTTSDPVDSRISSFGFDSDPNLVTASSTGTYNFALVGGQAPSPFNSVDVCFKAGGSNSCSGSGGLTDGQSTTGSLTLGFSQPVSSVTLSDFFVRYQSISGAGNVSSAIGGGTVTSTGGTTTGGSTGGTPVPEPGMLGLLGLGLIGVALMRRRQPSLRPLAMPLPA